MQNTTFSKLSKGDKKLLDAAEKATRNSYSPHSGFKVGAALLAGGEIISAANVENSSYPLAICAEMAAVAKAVSMGKRKFSAIAVIAKSGRKKGEVLTPCGGCRQVLHEFSKVQKKDIRVIMSDQMKKKVAVAMLSELLPSAFGHEHLR
jgi:cytidine deaminase